MPYIGSCQEIFENLILFIRNFASVFQRRGLQLGAEGLDKIGGGTEACFECDAGHRPVGLLEQLGRPREPVGLQVVEDRLAGRLPELPAALAARVHHLLRDAAQAHGLGKVRPQIRHDAAHELSRFLLSALRSGVPCRRSLQEGEPQQADPRLDRHLIAEGLPIVESADRPDLLKQLALPGDLLLKASVLRTGCADFFSVTEPGNAPRMRG